MVCQKGEASFEFVPPSAVLYPQNPAWLPSFVLAMRATPCLSLRVIDRQSDSGLGKRKMQTELAQRQRQSLPQHPIHCGHAHRHLLFGSADGRPRTSRRLAYAALCRPQEESWLCCDAVCAASRLEPMENEACLAVALPVAAQCNPHHWKRCRRGTEH